MKIFLFLALLLHSYVNGCYSSVIISQNAQDYSRSLIATVKLFTCQESTSLTDELIVKIKSIRKTILPIPYATYKPLLFSAIDDWLKDDPADIDLVDHHRRFKARFVYCADEQELKQKYVHGVNFLRKPFKNCMSNGNIWPVPQQTMSRFAQEFLAVLLETSTGNWDQETIQMALQSFQEPFYEEFRGYATSQDLVPLDYFRNRVMRLLISPLQRLMGSQASAFLVKIMYCISPLKMNAKNSVKSLFNNLFYSCMSKDGSFGLANEPLTWKIPLDSNAFVVGISLTYVAGTAPVIGIHSSLTYKRLTDEELADRLRSREIKPTKQQHEDGECLICLEDVTDSSYTTECGHVYHLECLAEWMNAGKGAYNPCPKCRKEIKIEISSLMPNKKEDEKSCPVCKTDRYLNPNLTLLVNLTCYHEMCENCINRLYSGGSAPCPLCKAMLRKQDFVKPSFENVHVEKECRIRKRVGKVYNKTIDDFDGNLRAYNDYLEEVEDLVFNLLNEVDVEETNARIEQYARDNAETIQRNTEFIQQEARMIAQILEDEKRDYKQRMASDLLIQQQESIEKQKKKQTVIEQLAASNKPAAKVLESLDDHKDDLMDIDGKEDGEEEGKRRGPSLMNRLQLARRNMLRIKEGDSKSENPFPDPLESNFIRLQTPLILPQYQDPSIKPFETEKYIAGGFSAKTVYKKALEVLYMSLQIPPPN